MSDLVKAWWGATMGGYYRLTDENRAEIVQLYNEGESRMHISKLVHRDFHTVTNVLIQAGIPIADRNGNLACPIPRRLAATPRGTKHDDQIAPTCFCCWCDRGLCESMTIEQHAEVIAAYSVWAKDMRERYERYTAETRRIRAYPVWGYKLRPTAGGMK